LQMQTIMGRIMNANANDCQYRMLAIRLVISSGHHFVGGRS
jgi:hypothetical protein